MFKYIFYWVKKTCLGVFRIKEIRDKDNETGLKATVLSIHYNNNYNLLHSDTINISKLEKKHFYDNYNLVYSDTIEMSNYKCFSIYANASLSLFAFEFTYLI